MILPSFGAYMQVGYYGLLNLGLEIHEAEQLYHVTKSENGNLGNLKIAI